MSTRQQLKDERGRIIGFLDLEPNGRRVMKDASNRIIGHFDPKVNRTFDRNNHLVGSGDLLATLLSK